MEENFRGVVNDYNCRFLGEIVGNAGLFCNLSDATRYIRFLKNRVQPLISQKTFALAAENYTRGMSEYEMADHLAAYGQPLNCYSMCATGERFTDAVVFPRNRQVALGDKFAVYMGCGAD